MSKGIMAPEQVAKEYAAGVNFNSGLMPRPLAEPARQHDMSMLIQFV